ncbi:hypothetical protein LXL04_031516 [Taraxacum kok-saghyz]
MVSFLIALSSLPAFFLFIYSKFRSFLSKTLNRLPPGPPGLPIIGNLHQLNTSDLGDHLWRLSKRYGPLMSLRLGTKKMSYNNNDVAWSPYGEYWREMRKICNLHLFSMERVNSFCSVREDEVFTMIDTIKTQILTKKEVNLSEIVMILTSNIISRVALGKRPYVYGGEQAEQQEVRRFQELLLECQALQNFKEMDECYQEIIDEHLNQDRPNKIQNDMVDILLQLKEESGSPTDLTFDDIKGVLMDILLGGTETSASAVVWAMTLLMKNPESLKKIQQEVRDVVGNKGKIEECDLYKLNYLKAVIKETFRLYPVAPLLVPRESRDRCILDGYDIPKKTLVYINAWAMGRDPNCWEKPEEFEPERFTGSNIDYKGMNFELIPFGSGRRGCPGILMGVVTIELVLSNLVYSFNWELPEGTNEINTLTTLGTVSHKKDALELVAKVYDHGRKN